MIAQRDGLRAEKGPGEGSTLGGVDIGTQAGIDVPVALDYATRRNPSTCRNHSSSWFQLAKMRLTR